MKKISALILAFSLTSSLSFAEPSTPRVDQRQQNQDRRIDQGVNSGQLTGAEERRLEKGQDRVENLEDQAKSDGVVTPAEKRRLERAQDRQNRKIYRAKHNNRVR